GLERSGRRHRLERRAGRFRARGRPREERPVRALRDLREGRGDAVQVEGRGGGEREDLPGAGPEGDDGADLARERLVRRLLDPRVERQLDVGALLGGQVQPLEQRLGAVAAGEVAVVRALDAGLALLDRRVADDVRGEAAQGVAAHEDPLPILPGGHADREELAVHADDPATVHALFSFRDERVAAALLEAPGGDDLPVAQEEDEQAECAGPRRGGASERAFPPSSPAGWGAPAGAFPGLLPPSSGATGRSLVRPPGPP